MPGVAPKNGFVGAGAPGVAPRKGRAYRELFQLVRHQMTEAAALAVHEEREDDA